MRLATATLIAALAVALDQAASEEPTVILISMDGVRIPAGRENFN